MVVVGFNVIWLERFEGRKLDENYRVLFWLGNVYWCFEGVLGECLDGCEVECVF